MFTDTFLKILGEDPGAYADPRQKTAIVILDLTFIIIPIILIILFISPFLYLWFKKKPFTLRNIFISLLIGGALVGFGIACIYFSIMLLHGLAVRDIYDGGALF